MTEPAREPSMEDILASIKKVIAEEKSLRPLPRVVAPQPDNEDEDVLELEEVAQTAVEPVVETAPSAPPADLGPPLVSQDVAAASRQSLAALQEAAASAPPQPQGNPLEAMVREMLRPMLKDWLEKHLPEIVDEHVKREISRITGAPL